MMSWEVLAREFGGHFPGVGEAVDLSEGTSLLRREAHSAMRIAAVYWPPAFASDIGFPFECILYDSLIPNAFADHAGGKHWAAMSGSMIFALAELAVRVAAEFPVPGEEERFEFHDVGLSGFRLHPDEFRHSREEAAAFFHQADAFGEGRLRLLNCLWLDAQVLVWRHELFHGALGHTRYLQERCGLGMMSEHPGMLDLTADDALLETRRALEFHADWAAFGSVLQMSLSNMDAAGSDLVRRFGLEWRAASLMAGILMLPAYFRVAETRGAPRGVRHPSAAARMLTFLYRLSEISDPVLQERWENGARLALRTFRAMGRRHQEFAIFDEMLSEVAVRDAEVERIACIDTFDSLQEELNRFSVLPLGHPHQGGIDPLEDDGED